MKFLFRSCCGESLSLAMRVAAEDNDVRLYVADSRYGTVGAGLVPKTRDFFGSVGWADIIVYDGTDKEAPQEAERLRNSGKAVVGGSAFADRLEHDRPFAISLVEKAGLLVPTHASFSGRAAFQKAQQFVSGQEEDSGWVWKPNGETPDHIKTFVTENREEIMRRLDEMEAQTATEGKWSPSFLLEEKVEGIEVSTEVWVSEAGLSVPNGTLERKRLMNGDLGEQVGCVGNAVWRYDDLEAPLVQRLLSPIAAAIQGKYRGPLDINAIVSEDTDDIYFLEFTPRFGYDAVFCFADLVDSFGGLLADIGQGRLHSGARSAPRFSVGVRATVPPFPYGKPHLAERRPIFGLDAGAWPPRVYPVEVRVSDRGELETSGPDGFVLVATGLGSSIGEAAAAAYDTVGRIGVPDIRYRTDIGQQAALDYRALEELELVPEESEEEDDLWG